MEIVYYGETICQTCTSRNLSKKNKAYYLLDDKYVCGVHSKKGDRIQLQTRPTDQVKFMREERDKLITAEIEDVASLNKEGCQIGNVILTRMYMMRNPEYVKGYLNVFPNYKHQNRSDGFGCMKLSPKSMGPIKHGQKGLPDALNLENFHQFSKVFKEEVDEKGDPSETYYKNRLEGYLDSMPHRHKYKGDGKNKNIPLYFLWVDKDGVEHRLDYISSRQFYCTFYQRSAEVEPDYLKLKSMLISGYNLNIIGYDANPIPNPLPYTIEKEYLDPSRPFGHEKVLFAMLILEPEDYPWIKHKTFDF